MSLARRFLGRIFSGKPSETEPEAETQVDTTEPLTQETDAPERRPAGEVFDITPGKAPAVAEHGDAPAQDAGNRELRRSQTIRVEAPDRSAANRPTQLTDPDILDAGNREMRRSQTIRVEAPGRSATSRPTQLTDPDILDGGNRDLRLSQTMRVSAPSRKEDAAAVDGIRDSGMDELKRSQTIRVMRPGSEPIADAADADSEPAEQTGGRAPQIPKIALRAPASPPEADGSRIFDITPAGDTDLPGVTTLVPDMDVETVPVPVRALLSRLPVEFRGPGWSDAGFPASSMNVPKEGILSGLATGRVTVELGDIRPQIPPGWVGASEVGEVELDLAEVVAVLPAELLAVSIPEDEDAAEAANMASLFRAKGDMNGMPPSRPAAAENDDEESDAAEPPENAVAIPWNAIAPSVPQEVRGPNWSTMPADARLYFDRDDVLGMLAAGAITLETYDLRGQLLPGVLADGPDGKVEVNLAAIVAVLPEDALLPSLEEDPDVVAAEKLGMFFRSNVETTPDDVEETDPEPVAERRSVPEKVPEMPEGCIPVPCDALLRVLPEAIRGAVWSEAGAPGRVMPLREYRLLDSLAAGRVRIALGDVMPWIPVGWVRGGADPATQLDLDLPTLVAGLPADLLEPQGELADDAREIADKGPLFRSAAMTREEEAKARAEAEAKARAEAEAKARAEAEAKARAEAEAKARAEAEAKARAEAEAKAHRPIEPEPVVDHLDESPELEHEDEIEEDEFEVDSRRSDGRSMLLPDWDGVEPSLEMAPRGLDINRAPAERLTTLPGVGEIRAQYLVEYRKQHGPFRSIYELGEIPGVGPVSFRKMTGLSLTTRGNRHAILEELLDLKAGGGPLLPKITLSMTALLGATGCVITNREGISLASTGTMKETGARYAALGARFFFRTQRHLQRFVEKDSDCLIVPGSRPPLLLLCAEDVVLIFALKSSHVSGKRLHIARRAAAEIGWLLGSRAVVTRS